MAHATFAIFLLAFLSDFGSKVGTEGVVIPTPVDFFDPQTRNWRARLAISVELMRELSRVTSPLAMEEIFARRMNQLFPTDRQLTVTRRGLARPFYRLTRFNLWSQPANPWTQPEQFPVFEGGLLGRLLYAEEPRVLEHVHLGTEDPAYDYLGQQQSLLAIPVFERGEANTMLLLARDEPNAFPLEQVPDLVWLSNLFARAMQAMMLSEALSAAYFQADYEHKAVAELQQTLLPAEIPLIPSLDLAVEYRTASRAGGDFYDFLTLENSKLGLLIADVSGHGSPAAMVMAILHTLAQHSPVPMDQPGAFLGYLNDRLAARTTATSGTFVTAFYAVFDPIAETVCYASAGHVPPRIVRKEDGSIQSMNRVQRLPLGINPKQRVYPDETSPFRAGDTVALFTDGVTESTDLHGRCFGTERIDAALLLSDGTASHRLAEILVALDAFAREAKDDRTILIVRHAGNKPLSAL